MTRTILAIIGALLATCALAHAQGATYHCANQAQQACAPGTEGCQCLQVIEAPVAAAPPVVVQQVPPTCPFGTYYSAGVCVQIAPAYTPYIPPVIYDNPWGNVPFNQQPGWNVVRPGVTPVPGGFVGPGGHFHPR